ncbi:D-aminoacyl-tRNA deacylase [Flavobacterium crassostreae]|uniref:D-aminoacyl-tRNA deacylase n=1 Tax=Flavobacterium crassostreae TaxID=1763534 RepID=A0A1B9DZQ8_9FLAO|nr:D-aminoacyl-tRNA deacylase [Flavobacterium crassostreae]OCB75148.1 D-tyrosyl-tRNA(Tyr) deacylase [Flavobacterium crassostreae]
MRVVIQRVLSASVTIEGKTIAQIQRGLLLLVGIENTDTPEDSAWLVSKISKMRIFEDSNKVMNLSLQDIAAEVLIVSQFTLHAATKKGNRPSYIKAAKPEISIPLYEDFVQQFQKELKNNVQTGKFGADMQVALLNDGPVTLLMDSKNRE